MAVHMLSAADTDVRRVFLAQAQTNAQKPLVRQDDMMIYVNLAPREDRRIIRRGRCAGYAARWRVAASHERHVMRHVGLVVPIAGAQLLSSPVCKDYDANENLCVTYGIGRERSLLTCRWYRAKRQQSGLMLVWKA